MSVLFLLGLAGTMSGQHKSWHQYTSKEGLPGNEVFDVLQDRNGLIWMATNQGICSFNGYEFLRPVDTSNFVGTETFVPTEDSEGRIWFARLDWSLWIIDHDTVKAWKYNHVLQQISDQKVIAIDQLKIANDGTVWISTNGLGILTISTDGSSQILRPSERSNILMADIDGTILIGLQKSKHQDERTKPDDSIELYWWQEENTKKIGVIPVVQTPIVYHLSAARLADSTIILAYSNDLYHIRENQISAGITSMVNFPKFKQTADGKILMVSYRGSNTGLYSFDSMEDIRIDKRLQLIEKFRVCNLFFDKDGGWWAASLDGGIFYCKNPDVDIFMNYSATIPAKILYLADDRVQWVYAGVWPQEIWKINNKTHERIQLPTEKGQTSDIWDLYYDTSYHRLWRSIPLQYFTDDQWQTIQFNSDDGNRKSYVLAKRISGNLSGSTYWLSSTFGFYEMDASTMNVVQHEMVRESEIPERTFAVTEDLEGNVWVATLQGLRIFKNGNLEKPPFIHPVLRNTVREIELLEDGSLVFGFMGQGVLYYHASKTLKHITTADGLSSNLVNRIKPGKRGEFYVCTNSGINRVTYDLQDRWKIELINVKHGLPSDAIHDITVLDNELWIATDRGLARIKTIPTALPMAPPVLKKMLVNLEEVIYVRDMQLAYDQNDIVIHFYSLHYRSEGDITYRYRYSEVDTNFIVTNNRQLNFLDLAPGRYKLEVQAQNEAGAWSESSLWSFTIGRPWWRSFWFISLLVIGIAGSGIMYYSGRLRNFKKEAAQTAKVKDLELAALRAQMNPHFIFNCLGSIQHFIADNDKASATRYLSRFAKLVRLSLHSSVDGRHTLPEEIEMLDNYLALEQMRFKGKFVYEIKLESISELNEISIPPMLIQPFVENAVLHGIRNKTDGGKISVAFRQEGNMLEATIIDNGPGISSNQEDGERDHKSVGMTLTGRRLDLLSHVASDPNYTLENITGPEGQILGTKACVRIPVE